MRSFGLPRLLALVLSLALGACGGPSTSPSPTASPAPAPSASASPISVAPTVVPTALPSPTPSEIPTVSPEPDYLGTSPLSWVNRFVMRVAVSDHNVREEPSRSAKSLGKAPKGGLFMMYDWPRQADGYTWYYGFTLLTPEPNVLPDLPTPIETGYDEVLGGWMATGTEDTPFLIPLGPRCPDVRNLLNVGAMIASERISCFGSDTLALEGRYRGEGCGGVALGTFEPEWLASPLECANLGPRVEDEVTLPIFLHFAPDGPAMPTDGTVIRIRGHFSDARSTTCRITVIGAEGDFNGTIPNEAAEQWCRAKFVVESYEVIG